ncbi:hypothetical protein GOBAR_AA39524 [Gossypium barbadense]|uniref:SCP domain-containing protein n=1 Tax=Gossypium barbadense TaxID=3634 RepID=A0A2P5VQX8_GOSBA|nr:hypothetical protein GOBAR_AA39524 [Gossypium barbadense]
MKRTSIAWTVVLVSALTACPLTALTGSYKRYVYHDVIRLDDATKLMDCASVQCKSDIYKPKATDKAVQRLRKLLHHMRQMPATPIDNLLRTEYGLSKFLYDCNYLPLPDVGLDDGLVTPEWVLEPSGSTKTSSGSDGYGEEAWCRALSCTATTEIVRKKRSSLTCPSVSGSLMNRRKKPPHRAPLY